MGVFPNHPAIKGYPPWMEPSKIISWGANFPFSSRRVAAGVAPALMWAARIAASNAYPGNIVETHGKPWWKHGGKPWETRIFLSFHGSIPKFSLSSSILMMKQWWSRMKAQPFGCSQSQNGSMPHLLRTWTTISLRNRSAFATHPFLYSSIACHTSPSWDGNPSC